MALISAVYRAYPSVCVALPGSVPSCKVPQPKDCGAFPVKMQRILPNYKLRRVSPNCGAFGKSAAIPYSTLAAQIQRQNIKVWHISYQNVVHKSIKNCILFDMYCIYRRPLFKCVV